jgi:hypothetical protein
MQTSSHLAKQGHHAGTGEQVRTGRWKEQGRYSARAAAACRMAGHWWVRLTEPNQAPQARGIARSLSSGCQDSLALRMTWRDERKRMIVKQKSPGFPRLFHVFDGGKLPAAKELNKHCPHNVSPISAKSCWNGLTHY